MYTCSCFTLLCYFLLYNKLNQLCVCVCIYTLYFEFPLHLGHHRALRTVTCATQVVPISYQGNILQNIQTAHVPKYKKKKKLNQRTGRSKQTFLQRRLQMNIKHMKRGSTSLIIRDMQIKSIMRYRLTPGRMAIIKKIFKQ